MMISLNSQVSWGLERTESLRTEGKEYVVQDGDIINFKFNV